MAGMGLSGGFAAGAGADALEEVLKRAFIQQTERRRAKQEDRRIDLDAQRVAQQGEMQKAVLASQDEARKATAQDREERTVKGMLSMLPPGVSVDPTTASRGRAAGFGAMLPHDAADLPSTAISGIAEAGAKAPMVGQLRMAAAGRPERDTFTGTDEQLTAQQARTDALARTEQARQDRQSQAAQAEQARKDAASESQKGREELVKLTASLRPPPTQQTITIQTVDANGNPVTKIVPKVAGSEFEKAPPVNAALGNRLASARVVNEVGTNMIQKLSDPKFAATVGPAMGRAGTLRDFIGNPPPEFSELAGQIESYALANMGVHGMRSAQGAEQIKHLLDQHHTPQSLAATIRGLNDFSTRLVQDSAPKAKDGKSSGFTVTEIKNP